MKGSGTSARLQEEVQEVAPIVRTSNTRKCVPLPSHQRLNQYGKSSFLTWVEYMHLSLLDCKASQKIKVPNDGSETLSFKPNINLDELITRPGTYTAIYRLMNNHGQQSILRQTIEYWIPNKQRMGFVYRTTNIYGTLPLEDKVSILANSKMFLRLFICQSYSESG